MLEVVFGWGGLKCKVPQRGSGIAEAILLWNADFSKYFWQF